MQDQDEEALEQGHGRTTQLALRRALDEYEQLLGRAQPHYVLMDLGPGMGTMFKRGLCATDLVLLPLVPYTDPVRGAQQVHQFILRSAAALGRPELRVAGIVPNNVNRREPEQARQLGNLTTALPGLEVWQEVPSWPSWAECASQGWPPSAASGAVRGNLARIAATWATTLEAHATRLAAAGA
jgi:cellulose biosynthesis protein BcsQ